jgi:hypothetical protein
MSEWIASWPAPVRHFCGIFIGAVIAFLAAAVLDANGITGLDLITTGRGALDAGAMAVATALGGVGVLAATPLTDAYGVSKPPDANDADDDLLEFEEATDGLS